MNWKALYDEQGEEVERKDATIAQLNRDTASKGKDIRGLRYKLAEQSEKLNYAEEANKTLTNDKISKLQLRLKIAEDDRDEIAKTAESFGSREQELLQHIGKLQTELLRRNAQVAPDAAEQGSEAARFQSQQVTELQDALKQAQTENEHLKAAQSNCYAHDEDDSETEFRNRPTSRRTATQPAPKTKAFTQSPSSFSQPSPAKQAPAKKLTAFPLRPKPSTQKVLATPKKAAPARKPAPTPANSTSVAQRAAAMPKKSPTKKGPLQQPASVKRKRLSEQDEIQAEMMELDPQSFVEPDTPRKKQRASFSERLSEPEPLDDSLDFEFKAVTDYDHNGGIVGHYDSEIDLKDVCPELWERIEAVKDLWEEAKGQDWQYEFTKPGYNQRAKHCVTTKMENGRVKWRPGCEGEYACATCVAANRPCFTWKAALKEFLLLPLHEEDRRKKVEKEFEIRYWINS